MHRLVRFDGHKIGISRSAVGRETVWYDDVVVSRAFSMVGGTHVFTVKEGDGNATYEIRLRSAWTRTSCRISVKINGAEAFSESVGTPQAGAQAWFLSAAVLVLLLLPSTLPLLRRRFPTEAPKLTNQEMIALRNTAKRNSVIVLAIHGDHVSKGSGFVTKRIGDKAIVATNAHVVLDGGNTPTSVSVKPLGVTSFTKGYLLYAQEDARLERDLALVLVHDPANRLGQEVELARSVKKGEFVLSVGSPLKEDFLVDDGVVKHVEVSSEGGSAIFHDALIEHGSSGGGLFNSTGQLVGINTYILEDGKTGVALSNDGFLSKLRCYSVKVSANAGWQNSGIRIAPTNRRVVVLAQGQWSIAGLLPVVDALGRNTDAVYERYSLFPALAHGALLMSLDGGETAMAIDRWWKGAVRENSAYLSLALHNQNRNISFRINDVDFVNNSGQIDVTVLIW